MVDPHYQQGSVPVPDPTALTDKAIERATGVFHAEQTSLREFMTEKIEGSIQIIKTRLDGNDTALVAALQAQKEAATKQTENFTAILDESKKGTTKQIDALNEKIDDLKERLSENSGKSSGVSSTLTMAIAAISAIAAVVALVLAFSRPPAPTHIGSSLMFRSSNHYSWDGY